MTPSPPSLRIDVAFVTSMQGPPLHTDYGYALLAALSRQNSNLHHADWLAVHPLAGSVFDDAVALRPRVPALRLRVPPEKLPEVVTLAGKTLDVAGTRLLLGVSQIYMLRPFAGLASRMVTIKGYLEPGP